VTILLVIVVSGGGLEDYEVSGIHSCYLYRVFHDFRA